MVSRKFKISWFIIKYILKNNNTLKYYFIHFLLNTFLYVSVLLGDYLSIGKWTSVFNAPRSTSGSVSCFPIKKTSVFVAWINPSVIPPKHIEGLSLILNPFSFESTLNYSDRNIDMHFSCLFYFYCPTFLESLGVDRAMARLAQ